MVEHPDVEPYFDALEIQNVVASSAIGQEIDLEALAMDLEGVDFDPEKFPGLIYRIEEPHATVARYRVSPQ